MTKYTLNWFDKVPGIVEQLLLATIAQEMANREYVPIKLLTNFVSESIAWNFTIDSESDSGTIDIKYRFVLDNFARQSLLDSNTLDQRVSAINPLHIDEVSLVAKSSYPKRSYPVEYLPTYLSTDNFENTLERRICWLLFRIASIDNWIQRWNACTVNWLSRKYDGLAFKAQLPELAEIEATRDSLINELSTEIKISKLIDIYGIERTTTVQIGVDEITGAQSELGYLGAIDPANEPANVSSGLLAQLKEQLQEYNNQFGTESSETPITSRSESPTLPDC